MDKDYIERLANQRFQGEFRNAFLAAIDQLTESMSFEQIVSLIEAGDIEGAVEAVGLEPENFENMQAVNAAAVAAAGAETARRVPARKSPPQRPPDPTDGGTSRSGGGDSRIKFSFNPGNPKAERAVDDLNTGLMRGLNGGPAITEEGKKAVRDHIRQGLENGDNPRTVARRMRGTWDSKAKAFRGGMIGLTDKQSKFVRNAERQLRSGDPTELRKYLGRRLRDKRFDRSILKAINDGTPVPEKTINNAVSGYNRKYIKFRSETVARDQALSALTQGQEESIDQAIRDGAVKGEQVVQTWLTARDERVRSSHRFVNGQKRKRGEAFNTPLGPLRFPRDPQGTPANVIQCRCTMTIQFLPPPDVPGG